MTNTWRAQIKELSDFWVIMHMAMVEGEEFPVSSIVKAETKREAFEMFNEQVADGETIFKIKSFEQIRPLQYFEAEG